MPVTHFNQVEATKDWKSCGKHKKHLFGIFSRFTGNRWESRNWELKEKFLFFLTSVIFNRLFILYSRLVWPHLTILASTWRESTMTVLSYTRPWRLKLDRWGASLVFHSFAVCQVCLCGRHLFILSFSAGRGLSSAWQCSTRLHTSAGGWDEVPDDSHTLACDGSVLNRTRENPRTFPSPRCKQGLCELW